MQPSFLASGTTPQPTDTPWTLWVKILGSIQNQAGSNPANDPKPNDTLRMLKVKIDRALSGV